MREKMGLYSCVPYREKENTQTDGERFYVRADRSSKATQKARDEAAKQGYPNVFVEDPGGFMIYDGPVGELV